MHQNLQKEELSYILIKMIALSAGFEVIQTGRASDNSGIDIIIRSPGSINGFWSPSIDAQVKCVSTASIYDDFIKYNLKVRNYKRLIGLSQAPQILILALVHKDVSYSLSVAENETVLRTPVYWLNLSGYEDTDKDNDSKITISIPKENLLTPIALKSMMEKIAEKYSKLLSLDNIFK